MLQRIIQEREKLMTDLMRKNLSLYEEYNIQKKFINQKNLNNINNNFNIENDKNESILLKKLRKNLGKKFNVNSINNNSGELLEKLSFENKLRAVRKFIFKSLNLVHEI